MAESIKSIDAYSIPWYFTDSELGEQYDFNGDGKVDIADYHLATYWLSDADSSNDVNFSQEELDIAFSEMKKFDADNNNYTEIQMKEANVLAESYLDSLAIGEYSPKNATTLLDLQSRGAQLSKMIKHFSEIQALLTTMIENLEKDIAKVEIERNEKENEYAQKESEVNNKTRTLQAKTNLVLAESQRMSEQNISDANSIIDQLVEDYKNGLYPHESLDALIVKKLAENSTHAFDSSVLDRRISQCDSIGSEIKLICNEITSLVTDIRTITQKYNSKTDLLNRSIENRTAVIGNVQVASASYQTGYAKRNELRQSLIDAYHTDGTGERYSSGNEQVQMLNAFLINNELANMTYADAIAVISGAFNDCGIKATKNGITIPKGHDNAATAIFNELVAQIKENFGVDTSLDEGYEDEETDPDKITRNDPISFTVENVKYEFIQDNNKNGKFDNETEFLGAKNGWDEMTAYDTNNDGQISGKELDKLKLLSVDQETGKYNFLSAKDANIDSIDLNSYQDINEEQINGNLLAGNFKLNVNGETINGQQTFDTMQNLNNTYLHIYGSDIKDQEKFYTQNPFMSNFQERVDTKSVKNDTDININLTEKKSEDNLDKAETKIKENASTQVLATKSAINKKEENKKEENKKEETNSYSDTNVNDLQNINTEVTNKKKLFS